MTASSDHELRYDHVQGRPQAWDDADADIRAFVDATVAALARLLAPATNVGASLHGSLAYGSFYRPKSDLDVLLVVDDTLSPPQRQAVAEALCDQSDRSPVIGDLEVSVLRRADTQSFHHPLPYEVHFSESWKQRILGGYIDWAEPRTDPDLAVHCKAVRDRGVRLTGLPIADVFGPVPVDDYRRSILDDLHWILDDDHLSESPYYGILNCCRVLRMEAEGWDRVLSKDEGGRWALHHLPQRFRPLVAQALACYRSSEPTTSARRPTDGHDWDTHELAALRDYVNAALDLPTRD